MLTMFIEFASDYRWPNREGIKIAARLWCALASEGIYPSHTCRTNPTAQAITAAWCF
jgi:hypothetical protein